jgi:hypothetical protein
MWQFNGAAHTTTIISTRIMMSVYQNTVEVSRGTDVGASTAGGVISDIVPLNAGDTVGLIVLVGASTVFVGLSAQTFFSVEYHGSVLGS